MGLLFSAFGCRGLYVHRYGSELHRTVEMLETHDLGHSVYRSLVRLLQTGLQVSPCTRPGYTPSPSVIERWGFHPTGL